MNFQYLWSKSFKKVRMSAMRNCHIDETSTVESGSSLVDVIFGKHSFCGYDCEMTNVEVGSFCSIANGVIIGGGMHPIEWVSMSPVFYEGRDSVKAKFAEYTRDSMLKTVVGHDVWIGQNVLVKQGVTIGTGAVVGMGSVVTKDIPSYEVWAGNPARFIKRRFDENLSELLNESKWWDMDDNLLKECAKFIKSPEKFLNCMNKGK